MASAVSQIRDVPSLLAALKVCGDIHRGRSIHAAAVESGKASNVHVATCLIRMYARCGSLVDACGVFDRMWHRDAASWNALIMGYAENGEGDKALRVFARMNCAQCVPNVRTFVAAAKACSGDVQVGRAVHCCACVSGCGRNIVLETSLVSMYVRLQRVSDARRVFDDMAVRNAVTWTVLVMGYVENGEGRAAVELFARMQRERCPTDARALTAALKACETLEDESARGEMLTAGQALHSRAVALLGESCDTLLTTTLVNVYARCGSISDARRIFDRMPKRDSASWNALLYGYVENGQGEEVVQLFAQMTLMCRPDARTYVAALKACSMVAGIQAGRAIHSAIPIPILRDDAYVVSTLVDFYGKCGSMGEAQRVFDASSTKCFVSWMALMEGYGRSGDATRALQVFGDMEEHGVEPNEVTLLCLLTACSHAGLVGQGLAMLQTMRSKYGIIPTVEHTAGVVDMLSRTQAAAEHVRTR